jgi:hypothetical protein
VEQLEAAIDRLKPRLIRAFWFALALIFLFESWLWDNVKEWLRRLERTLGLERLEPWLEGFVSRLSPPKTLALFAIPMVAVLPFKVLALEMLAHGHIVLGLAFIFLVKTLTLGVEAFLFDHCRDKLLEMEWFGRFYSLVLDARAWATMLVRPYKARLLEMSRGVREYLTARMGSAGGDFGRRIVKLRERLRAKDSA